MNESSGNHVARQATQGAASRYWKKNLGWLGVILLIWFVVSFGCGILFRDWLDLNFPKVGNAPFGFWMAQQGSIISFVVILIGYTFVMNKLDNEFAVNSKESK